jgi:hypothetical protein
MPPEMNLVTQYLLILQYLPWLLTQNRTIWFKTFQIIRIKFQRIHIHMLFSIPYSIPYPEHHFEIGYPYPLESLKSDMETFKRIRRRFRCENYPIHLHPY